MPDKDDKKPKEDITLEEDGNYGPKDPEKKDLKKEKPEQSSHEDTSSNEHTPPVIEGVRRVPVEEKTELSSETSSDEEPSDENAGSGQNPGGDENAEGGENPGNREEAMSSEGTGDSRTSGDTTDADGGIQSPAGNENDGRTQSPAAGA